MSAMRATDLSRISLATDDVFSVGVIRPLRAIRGLLGAAVVAILS